MRNIKEYFSMLSTPSLERLSEKHRSSITALQNENDNLSLILDILDYIEDYEEDESEVIGIFDKGDLIGFILCAYLDDDSYFVDEVSGSNFEYRIINDITISPKYRNRGIAEALITYNADLIREDSSKPLALFADPLTEDVIPFYARQGFVECGDLYYKVFK